MVDYLNVYSDEERIKMYTKKLKERKVSNITVTTTSGKVFDGDEKSQDRILRAINVGTITGESDTRWKLFDNSIETVTIEELKEALELSAKEMSRIWLT